MPELPPRLKVLYPFEGKTFASSSGQLHYLDEGDGPAILMFHGNPTWSFFYRNVVLGLRNKHRCLALDNLGCGFSGKPQKGDYTLAGHIKRACEWVESTGVESAHLVVHDWGGPIGLGMAARLHDRIKSISILNTAAFPFPTIPARIAACRFPFLGAFLVRSLNAFARGATRMTTVEPLSEAVTEGYLYPYGNWHDRVAVHAFVRDIPMRSSHRSWETLQELEKSLSLWREKPVQLLWGMHDWCFHDKFLAQWQSILPDAEVQRFEKAGHYLLEDAGEEVTAAIGNLAGNL
ncbi:MAG: alpha/beta fold hydrolase [Puniceicoccaceae bacterium]